jgi:hypothetical protein
MFQFPYNAPQNSTRESGLPILNYCRNVCSPSRKHACPSSCLQDPQFSLTSPKKYTGHPSNSASPNHMHRASSEFGASPRSISASQYTGNRSHWLHMQSILPHRKCDDNPSRNDNGYLPPHPGCLNFNIRIAPAPDNAMHHKSKTCPATDLMKHALSVPYILVLWPYANTT